MRSSNVGSKPTSPSAIKSISPPSILRISFSRPTPSTNNEDLMKLMIARSMKAMNRLR